MFLHLISVLKGRIWVTTEEVVTKLQIEGGVFCSVSLSNINYHSQVWDRRNLLESAPTPVGIFAGHKDGITFIDSKVHSIVLLL